jgi:hypothetical protein
MAHHDVPAQMPEQETVVSAQSNSPLRLPVPVEHEKADSFWSAANPWDYDIRARLRGVTR